jgi:hypothetical protein
MSSVSPNLQRTGLAAISSAGPTGTPAWRLTIAAVLASGLAIAALGASSSAHAFSRPAHTWSQLSGSAITASPSTAINPQPLPPPPRR